MRSVSDINDIKFTLFLTTMFRVILSNNTALIAKYKEQKGSAFQHYLVVLCFPESTCSQERYIFETV